MNKGFKQFIVSIVAILTVVVEIFYIVWSLIYDIISFKIIYLIILITLFGIIVALFMKLRNMQDSKFSKLQKLISYNQKREEIEQEINALTYELMKSSLAEYVDINRLVYSGQNNFDNSNIINYNEFLEQFGIRKEKIQIKENFVLFLSPFDKDGERLFETCQKILIGLDMFLQRTDNVVEKDDILMNIVTMILQAKLIIVNINGRNPNVYYELGIAHALGKQTILISKANYSQDEIGFDIRQKRIIMYRNERDLEMQLLYQINRLEY